jgi:hypothetical protein
MGDFDVMRKDPPREVDLRDLEASLLRRLLAAGADLDRPGTGPTRTGEIIVSVRDLAAALRDVKAMTPQISTSPPPSAWSEEAVTALATALWVGLQEHGCPTHVSDRAVEIVREQIGVAPDPAIIAAQNPTREILEP